MHPRAFVCLLSASLAPAAILTLSNCEPMGGCPWIETTEVTITPSADCIQVQVPDGQDATSLGGCVNPGLRGTNTCEQTLTIPADPDGGWSEQVIAPGGTIDFEILLQANVDERRNRYFFEVPATLGDSEVVFAFETFGAD